MAKSFQLILNQYNFTLLDKHDIATEVWVFSFANMTSLVLTYADQENRPLGNFASPSDAASTRQPSSSAGGSKYPKKPVPLPRTKAPNKAPQMSPEHIHGPIQEEDISASSSTPILPHEETAYKPGVEAEEDQDDSGIGHAGDWTSGMMHF